MFLGFIEYMAALQKILKLHNGKHYTVFSAQDIATEKHNARFYQKLYEFPKSTHIFSYIELNCDKVEHIEATLHTLLRLQLIDLNSFLKWFGTLEIIPDYFRPDKPEFQTQRYQAVYQKRNTVLDFYLCGSYELLSEKNVADATRLQKALEILGPKLILEREVPFIQHKAEQHFKI